MYLNQLSVFIENREGRLDEVLETLKEENINIVSLANKFQFPVDAKGAGKSVLLVTISKDQQFDPVIR
mgnify:CR=1 FL=1